MLLRQSLILSTKLVTQSISHPFIQLVSLSVCLSITKSFNPLVIQSLGQSPKSVSPLLIYKNQAVSQSIGHSVTNFHHSCS